MLSNDRTKSLKLKSCRGVNGCPHSAADGAAMNAAILELMRNTAAETVGASQVHRMFRIGLACCPNACSQPQIMDFGLIGSAHPHLTGEACLDCGACVSVCREDALRIEGTPPCPVLDASRCLSCGACARACPGGVLHAGPSLWRVMVGGRLGRHPALAVELPGQHDVCGVLRLLKAALDIRAAHPSDPRRFGAILDSGSDMRDMLRLAQDLQQGSVK